MSDLLIRDVPPEEIAAIDALAERMGLSRAEFLRRTITQAAGVSSAPIAEADWIRFAELTTDLGNEEIMRAAWQ